MAKRAIIIGAEPSGLTAAYELLLRTGIILIILEKSGEIGGTSRTINYKGNCMDMGPLRFFSKSDHVMDWRLKMMPLEAGTAPETTISYQNKARIISSIGAPISQKLAPRKTANCGEVVPRLRGDGKCTPNYGFGQRCFCWCRALDGI